MVRASRRCFPPRLQTSTTVILFWVRVPVLSEQMTPAQPRVSTAGRRLTMALRRTIRCTPRARTMVTMAGSPSGMAATARETAVRNMSSRSFPWRSPTPNMTAQTHRHRKERLLEISPIFRWRGVSPSPSSRSIPAMRPISVRIPVSVTTQTPRPPVTTVPERTMFFRSPRAVSRGRGPQAAFSAGTGSPVMADSSVRSPAHSSTRPSAGTRSPASRWMMSPGTSLAASTRQSCPSRTARAMGADRSRRASRAFSALSSWEMEMTALRRTMPRMMTASIQSRPPPAHRETPAAHRSTTIMGSFIWARNRLNRGSGVRCSSSLPPYRSSRRRASAEVRPSFRPVSSSSSTSSVRIPYHALMSHPLPFSSLYQKV